MPKTNISLNMGRSAQCNFYLYITVVIQAGGMYMNWVPACFLATNTQNTDLSQLPAQRSYIITHHKIWHSAQLPISTLCGIVFLFCVHIWLLFLPSSLPPSYSPPAPSSLPSVSFSCSGSNLGRGQRSSLLWELNPAATCSSRHQRRQTPAAPLISALPQIRSYSHPGTEKAPAKVGYQTRSPALSLRFLSLPPPFFPGFCIWGMFKPLRRSDLHPFQTHSLGSRLLDGFHDSVHVEVAFVSGSWADADGFVCHFHVHLWTWTQRGPH